MAKNPFNVDDKVKLVFSKERFKDPVDAEGNAIYHIGADDKKYTGTIVLVQDNGYCTVDFVQGGEERQVSIPATELEKA